MNGIELSTDVLHDILRIHGDSLFRLQQFWDIMKLRLVSSEWLTQVNVVVEKTAKMTHKDVITHMAYIKLRYGTCPYVVGDTMSLEPDRRFHQEYRVHHISKPKTSSITDFRPSILHLVPVPQTQRSEKIDLDWIRVIKKSKKQLTHIALEFQSGRIYIVDGKEMIYKMHQWPYSVAPNKSTRITLDELPAFLCMDNEQCQHMQPMRLREICCRFWNDFKK